MGHNSRFYNIFCGKGTQILQIDRYGLKVDILVRDVIIYFVFLLTTTVIAVCLVTPTMFYFTNPLFTALIEEPFDSEGLTSFKTLNNVPDLWLFLENRFLKTVYSRKSPFLANETKIQDDNNYILDQNILLGSPRLRQLRVRNDSCKIVRDFEKAVQVCYGDYTSTTASTEPFGPGVGTAWTYSTEAETDSQGHAAKYSSYDGSGYYQDLGITLSGAEEKLKHMKENLWTDQATRVVFLDFVIYNPNKDIFSVIRLVAEMPPLGGVAPSWEFQSAFFNHLESKMDYFILTCEIVFSILIGYYLLREIVEVCVLSRAYFYCPWNYLDVTIITTSIACVVFFVYKYYKFNHLVSNYIAKPRNYPNFEKLGYWQMQFQYTFGLVAFLSWIKVFQYIRFNQTMAQLSATLSRCAKEILGFGIMFLVVYLGFALLGCNVFGTELKEYRTIPQAIITLFRTILGDFDFEAMQDAQPIIGPLYFICFVFFVFFCLTNMFLAIISDTYTQVKEEYQENESTAVVQNPNYFKLAGAKMSKKCRDCFRRRKNKYEKLKLRVGIMRLRKGGMTKSEVDAALASRHLDEAYEIDQKYVDDILNNWQRVKEEKKFKAVSRNPRTLASRKNTPQQEKVNVETKISLEERISLLEKRLQVLEAKSFRQPNLDMSSD